MQRAIDEYFRTRLGTLRVEDKLQQDIKLSLELL